MSRILPPPPDPRDNRAFRDWLYKVYAVVNGLDPAANITGAEDSPPVAGVADLAVASRMAADAQMLAMRSDVDQLRADVDRLVLLVAPVADAPDQLRADVDRLVLPVAPVADAPDQLRAMVQAAQANIGAIQKRIDEVMIWQ
jgi:outer membrane murein-binding lipoprotein Lpp